VPVCYVIGSLHRCGTAVHLLSLLRNIDRSRFEPWVVSLVQRGPIADDIRSLGIEVVEYHISRVYRPSAVTTCLDLARRIRQSRTPIVQTYVFLDNVVGLIAGRLGGARAVIGGRRTVDEWESPRHRQIYRLLNGMVDRIVVVSAEVEQSVMRWEKLRAEKIALIPNAQSRATLDSRTDPEDQRFLAGLDERIRGGFVFGTVGNVRPIKGHDILVRAFARVRERHREAHLVIVGSGGSLPQIEALVERLGLHESVHLAGRRTDVAAFLERMDVFVMPSRAEGMSNAMLEAMLLDLPVVATQFPDPESDAVLRVAPEDDAALAEAMGRVMTDHGLRDRLRESARRYIAARCNEVEMARAYEALYDELVGG